MMMQRLLKLAVGAWVFAPKVLFAANAQCSGLQAIDSTAACNGSALTGKVGTVINVLFYVAGAVAIIIMIIGGIRYITSTGDGKRIQASKDTILYAIAGLIIVILARAIVGFVVGQIGGS